MKTVWTDRSRVETFQRCARLRFLSYHEGGLGLSPAKESLPLAVGKSVHKGLETLLRDTSAYVATAPSFPAKPCWPSAFTMGTIEDAAVAAALADFAPHRHGIALDLAEESARAATMDLKDAGLGAQLVATAADLGMDPADPALASLLERQRNAGAEFDDWLWQEQAALVEGLVRAYAKRRLRPLLEEFEVLEVEREGDWELASLVGDDGYWRCDHCGIAFHSPNLDTSDLLCGKCKKGTLSSGSELRFMSRPDALLRSRADNSLYLLSYKTAAAWDVRKARDAEHDMQGLSEGVEVEKRLARWWGALQPLKREHEHATLLGHLMQEIAGIQGQEGGMPSEAMLLFLFHFVCSAPHPRHPLRIPPQGSEVRRQGPECAVRPQRVGAALAPDPGLPRHRRSKGLDWPVVLLLRLHQGRRQREQTLLQDMATDRCMGAHERQGMDRHARHRDDGHVGLRLHRGHGAPRDGLEVRRPGSGLHHAASAGRGVPSALDCVPTGRPITRFRGADRSAGDQSGRSGRPSRGSSGRRREASPAQCVVPDAP
jgi:hypothetical protein